MHITHAKKFEAPTGAFGNYIDRLMFGITQSFPWSVGTKPGEESHVLTNSGQSVTICHSPERAREFVEWANEARLEELDFPPRFAQAQVA